MAKKRKMDQRRKDLIREALLISALAVEFLLLVALVIHGPDGEAQADLVGVVGHFFASCLYGGFGLVAFALVVMALYTTVLAVVRKQVSAPMMRLGGSVLVMIGACCLLYQFWDHGVSDVRADLSGGLLGQIVFDLLRTPFGALGTFVLSVTILCTGFAFATDWLVYEMIYDGARRLMGFATYARRYFPQPVLGQVGAAAKHAVTRAMPGTSTGGGTAVLEAPEEEEYEDEEAYEEEEDELEYEAEEEEIEEPARPVLQVQLPEPPPTPKRPKELQLEKPRTPGEYEFPSPQLLDRRKPVNRRQLERSIQESAEILQRTLAEFRVDGRVVDFQQGPVVTMLEVSLAPGTKVTKIHALADDLAMALKAQSVRIVAPIPGKSTVGVEVPNPVREDVRISTLVESDLFRAGDQQIPLFLGVGADGHPIIGDLTRMPHLLLAGATGSGKSVCINTVLLSILLTRTPDDVKLILVDPKQVELAFFADIPHLLAPVVTDNKRATSVLEWAVQKMEERYDLMRRFEVRNIRAYNTLGEKAIAKRAKELVLGDEVIPVKLPYIVIIVDELADLMLTAGKDIEKVITRLAQKSRAVGIHIILATQRPSTDVITGLIKANMPTRIAFKVTSKVDSRVVLDQNGADKLLGAGDLLYLPPRSSTVVRAQGTYVSDKEVKRVVAFLKQRYSQEFNEQLVQIGSQPVLGAGSADELYPDAVRVVLTEQRGSASLLQRALGIGYTRASRLLDLMRKEGVVGAYKGSKASEVLMTLEEYEEHAATAGSQPPGEGAGA